MRELGARLSVALARHPWLTVFLGVAAVYLLTAHYAVGQNSDAIGASWPAYAFVHSGSFRLDGVAGQLPQVPGFIEVDGHVVAARTMGVLLSALPLQAALGWTGASPTALGAATAALFTAAGVATLFCAVRPLVSSRTALAGIAVLAFGSACWTVAGAELWTHGPDVLWLALALLGMSRGRYWLAGWAFAPAVMTRPHLVLVAAPLGLWAAWHRRRPWPLVQFGVPGLAAVAATYAWNGWYYGQPSITGSYAGHVERAIGTGGQSSLVPSLWVNLLGTTISPWCGVLLFSPVVLVAALALPRHARSAPGWTKAAAIGAGLYLLGQLRVAHFDGGGALYGNRYLIEPMVLTLPLGLVSARAWVSSVRWRRVLTVALGAVSVAVYAMGALLTPFWLGTSGDWAAWYPYVVLRAAGPTGVVMALVAVLSVGLVTVEAWRRPASPTGGADGPAGPVSELAKASG
ncbi:MAG: hypothetical protein JWP11_1474 [Frankiales bacterium]|nr:hypothetical protein [Frankiales bacterium]